MVELRLFGLKNDNQDIRPVLYSKQNKASCPRGAYVLVDGAMQQTDVLTNNAVLALSMPRGKESRRGMLGGEKGETI